MKSQKRNFSLTLVRKTKESGGETAAPSSLYVGKMDPEKPSALIIVI